MYKTTVLLLLMATALLCTKSGEAQCVTALPAPACSGSEPLASDGETIGSGLTKWYYGTSAVFDNLTLGGGTLVVCGALTVDKFYMDSGTIFIRPGASFIVGSGIGAGLQFKGGCSIYNYGTCEIRRNLTLENPATASRPNLIVNAVSSSVFRMSNQYLVISNAFSKFVNNGQSEFWGIITDNQSTAGSVCLGDGSSTRMAVLINRIANTYTVPAGNACVNVYQYSEFYGSLTASPTLFVCLGGSHNSATSCIPFGCTPNHWGSAQVFTDCNSCAALTVLRFGFTSFAGTETANGQHQLNWSVSGWNAEWGDSSYFQILSSGNGNSFSPLVSLFAQRDQPAYSYLNVNPSPYQPTYYMIRFINSLTRDSMHSPVVRLLPASLSEIKIFPVPFTDHFSVLYADFPAPERIMLTDLSGRNVQTRLTIRRPERRLDLETREKLAPGLYILHLQVAGKVMARTILKE